MHQQSTVASYNDFRRVSTVKRALPEHIRQEYRNEIKPLIEKMQALLPLYQRCVDSIQYSDKRDELMVLATCFSDDSLDIYGLESLVQHLKKHQQVFATALGEPIVAG